MVKEYFAGSLFLVALNQFTVSQVTMVTATPLSNAQTEQEKRNYSIFWLCYNSLISSLTLLASLCEIVVLGNLLSAVPCGKASVGFT